jgi:hypothetical protein
MLQPVSLRIATTMADSTKGSVTNKTQCTKEHIKNDAKTLLTIGVPAAAVGVAMVKKPDIGEKLALYAGKTMAKVYSGAAKLLGKTKLKNTKVLNTLITMGENTAKNAKKAGHIGLTAAGIAFVGTTLIKHAFKEGQIDQKYTDSAKIEAKSKNIILEQENAVEA